MDYVKDFILNTDKNIYKLKNKISGTIYEKDRPILFFEDIPIDKIVINKNIIQTILDLDEHYKLVLETEISR